MDGKRYNRFMLRLKELTPSTYMMAVMNADFENAGINAGNNKLVVGVKNAITKKIIESHESVICDIYNDIMPTKNHVSGVQCVLVA